jgi:hypothetical protein
MVSRIVISWNPPHNGVKKFLERAKANCSVPVFAVLHRNNDLMNKFRLKSPILPTATVLHLDNGIFISKPVLLASFSLFKARFADSIMGFFCASHQGNDGYISYEPGAVKFPPQCHFVLMGMAFLNHQVLHKHFFEHIFKSHRLLVKQLFSGEDLLMNAVAATRNTQYAVHFSAWSCLQSSQIKFDVYVGHNCRYGKPLWDQRMTTFEGKRINRRSYFIKRLMRDFSGFSHIESVCEQNLPDIHILVPFFGGDPLELNRVISSILRQNIR